MKLRGMVIGLGSIGAIVCGAGAAFATSGAGASTFTPATSADAPYIQRDFTYSAGALYNSDSAAAHVVTASLGISDYRYNSSYYVNGWSNGLTTSCTIYAQHYTMP